MRGGAHAGRRDLAELAARLIGNPDTFTAVFFIIDGGKLAGTLQLGGLETAPTR